MKPGKLVQILLSVFLENKIEAKMPRFETRQTEASPRAQMLLRSFLRISGSRGWYRRSGGSGGGVRQHPACPVAWVG